MTRKLLSCTFVILTMLLILAFRASFADSSWIECSLLGTDDLAILEACDNDFIQATEDWEAGHIDRMEASRRAASARVVSALVAYRANIPARMFESSNFVLEQVSKGSRIARLMSLVRGEANLHYGKYAAARADFSFAREIEEPTYQVLAEVGIARVVAETNGPAYGLSILNRIDRDLLAKPSDWVVSHYHLQAAIFHLSLGQTEEASIFLSMAIELDPDNLEALSYAGLAEARQGDLTSAEAKYRAVLARLAGAPDLTNTKYRLAALYLRKEYSNRNPSHALDLILEAIADWEGVFQSASFRAHRMHVLAVSYTENGNFYQAHETYLEAAATDPDIARQYAEHLGLVTHDADIFDLEEKLDETLESCLPEGCRPLAELICNSAMICVRVDR